MFKTLLLAVLVALNILTPRLVKAEPVAVTEQDGVKITLHNDECRLTDVVGNLPYRATWEENGNVIEGCFTIFGGVVVAFYFEDKSVAVGPAQAFVPLKSI